MSDAAPAGGSTASRGASTDPDEIHPDAIDPHIHKNKTMSNGIHPATTDKADGPARDPPRTDDRYRKDDPPKVSARHHGQFFSLFKSLTFIR